MSSVIKTAEPEQSKLQRRSVEPVAKFAKQVPKNPVAESRVAFMQAEIDVVESAPGLVVLGPPTESYPQQRNMPTSQELENDFIVARCRAETDAKLDALKSEMTAMHKHEIRRLHEENVEALLVVRCERCASANDAHNERATKAETREQKKEGAPYDSSLLVERSLEFGQKSGQRPLSPVVATRSSTSESALKASPTAVLRRRLLAYPTTKAISWPTASSTSSPDTVS